MNPTTVRLSPIGHDRLTKLCAFYGCSHSDLFRRLVEQEWQLVGDKATRYAEQVAQIRANLHEAD